MEVTRSPKTLRQRKMLLILPLVALPLITLLFWALGGGKAPLADKGIPHGGFNPKLPDAQFREGGTQDKMSYYDKAALDSARREELERKDPNYLMAPLPGQENTTAPAGSENQGSYRHKVMSKKFYRNAGEEKVYQKLAALQKAIASPAAMDAGTIPSARENPGAQSQSDGAAMERLEQMMQAMHQQPEQDPEMQQINGMLENILDIQHPERAQEKLRRASQLQRGQVFSISAGPTEDYLSSLQGSLTPAPSFGSRMVHNEFYSLALQVSEQDSQNAVTAVIHENQTIINGSTVKLRLTSDIYVNGTRIAKDNFIFGLASLKGERLTVKITSLRFENSLFPVELSVYDMDGLEGIYIPGAISRDVAKASADRSAQSLGVTTLDDSLTGQAAGAGIEAAKSLFSKKVKLIKVVVKAGYQVLLRDEKQKQNNSN